MVVDPTLAERVVREVFAQLWLPPSGSRCDAAFGHGCATCERARAAERALAASSNQEESLSIRRLREASTTADPGLLVPSLLTAQMPASSSQPSDIARAKKAAMPAARRMCVVRRRPRQSCGDASDTGTSAGRATPATHPGDGSATRATPARRGTRRPGIAFASTDTPAREARAAE